MKFKSAVYTQASGSIGGITYSRNRGGMYTRARATPVDPGTLRQVVVRLQMSSLSNRWVDTLTTTQRLLWDAYSENVQLPDRLGEPRNAGGLGMYVRSNLPRRLAGLPTVDDAPVIFDLGEFTPITDPTSDNAPEVGFGFTATDDWANEDDAAMLVFTGRPVNPTVNYYKGPWRFAGQVAGASILPPTSPAAIPNPYGAAIDQKTFFRVQVSRADGRYSTTQRISAITVIAPVLGLPGSGPAGKNSKPAARKAPKKKN